MTVLDALLAHIGFLGNLHPVAVHFPLALIPVALLFLAFGNPTLRQAAAPLLILGLAFALIAAALGLVYANVNHLSSRAVATHANLAGLTLIFLVLAIFLPQHKPESPYFTTAQKAVAGIFSLLKTLTILALRISKVIAIILFLPLALTYLLLKKLYVFYLARRVHPRLLPLRYAVHQKRSRANLWLKKQFLSLCTLHHVKNAAYTCSLALLFLTAYHGSNLVHGPGHLLRNAPSWLTRMVVSDQRSNATLDTAYFDKKVQPILRKNCVKCHGADKAKGGIRLHTVDAIIAANVVQFESPYTSELVKRVLLARDDPNAMPPPAHGHALAPTSIATLIAWVNGATLMADGQLTFTGRLPPSLEAITRTLPALDNAFILQANRYGAVVIRLREDTPLLGVNLQFVDKQHLDTVFDQLTPMADHIVDLDIAGRVLDDRLLENIMQMNNLVRLNLSRTVAGDATLLGLAELQKLQWLNAYGASMSDHDREALRNLPTLKTFYAERTDSALLSEAQSSDNG